MMIRVMKLNEWRMDFFLKGLNMNTTNSKSQYWITSEAEWRSAGSSGFCYQHGGQ